MESKRDQSDIDFLQMLPIELWRAIFSAIPLHPALTIDDSPDPLLFLTTKFISRHTFYDEQKERFSLMNICKALRPLAEEQVYSRVGVGAEAIMNGTFEKTFMSPLVGTQRRRGELTTHLWVLRAQHLLAWPWTTLQTTLPNLRSFHYETTPRPTLDVNSMSNGQWSLGIAALTLKWDVTWEDIHTLSLSFPRLRVLKVLSACATPSTQQVTFPLLETLIVEAYVSNTLPLHNLHLPALRWLHVSTSFTKDCRLLNVFIENVGSTLVGVQMGYPHSAIAYKLLHEGIFDNIPNLKTLIFRLKDAAAEEPLLVKSHSLEHLVVEVFRRRRTGCSPTAVKAYLRNFASRAVFPSLNRVTIGFLGTYIDPTLVPDLNVLIEAAKKVIPHAVIEGVGLQFFTSD